MHQKDEQIRKQMDEFNTIKTKIQQLTKKEGGSLQVRDFTDDIYNKNVPAETFVESHSSEMFANLLFVIHQDKFNPFMEQANELMNKYYETMDRVEERRILDKAKKVFGDIMKEHQKVITAKEKLEEEEAAAAAKAEEEKKAPPKITEEQKQ